MYIFLEFRFTKVSAYYKEAVGINIEKLLGNRIYLEKPISRAKGTTKNANVTIIELAFLVAPLVRPIAHYLIRLFF